jgi:hypothetical protein
MSSSYFITYGGNRLTLPGVTGSVAWEYVPVPPKTDRVYQLWSGAYGSTASSITLPSAVSSFDALIIDFGQNGIQQQIYWPISNATTGRVDAYITMVRSSTSPYWMHRAERIDISAVSSLHIASGAVIQYNPWNFANNALTTITNVKGVKYGH